MAQYGIRKTLDCTFDEAVAKTREELSKEGFGILTEIDVKATLKKKLDADFRNYMILGACNPSFALKVLNLEIEIGLFLPCNVIVYDHDDEGVVVSAIDPMVMMSMIDTPGVSDVAREVREKIDKVMAAL